jgi:hypothetical protein
MHIKKLVLHLQFSLIFWCLLALIQLLRRGLQGCAGSLPGGLANFRTGLYALAVDIEALNILTNELVVSQDHMMVGY